MGAIFYMGGVYTLVALGQSRGPAYMSVFWAIALKLLGLQCQSFAQRYPYILSWECLWSFERLHSTVKMRKLSPPSSRKMMKFCNSCYAQKRLYWDLTFLGMRETPYRVAYTRLKTILVWPPLAGVPIGIMPLSYII